jgi:hypothetical protein
MLFKSSIQLSVAGVKIRERKTAAAARRSMRAAALLRQLMKVQDSAFERALGMSPMRHSLNMPKRPQGVPLDYERRRLESPNPCSISFSDQFPRKAEWTA